MDVVVYQCDTCKRVKEYRRSLKGIESFGRCTITLGCRGSLTQIKVLHGYSFVSPPKIEPQLDDWTPRKVLYDHIQISPSDEWIINHNLGSSPSIAVFEKTETSNGSTLIPITPTTVDIIDDNTIKISFDRDVQGQAQLTVRSSDPSLLNSQSLTSIENNNDTTTINDSIRISVNSEITIATRILNIPNTSAINLRNTFTTPLDVITTVMQADNTPSINSAWNDVSLALINDELYSIRSFSGFIPEMTLGAVPSGSTMQIEQLDIQLNGSYTDYSSGDILILLSTPPHTTYDKIKTIVIDAKDTSLIIEGSEFNVSSQKAIDVHPQIITVNE